MRSYYKVPAELKVLVGSASASPDFPNYESIVVTIDSGDKKQDLKFLVSKDQMSMMRVVKFDLSKDPYAETMSKIDTSGRPRRGAKASKVVVVNFDDLECPFCSRMHQGLFPEILKEYGDRVTFVYKDYPLVEIHPWATHAAVDANCLAAQNNDAYWDFADYIHANQHDVSNEKTSAARFEENSRPAYPVAGPEAQPRQREVAVLHQGTGRQRGEGVHEGSRRDWSGSHPHVIREWREN